MVLARALVLNPPVVLLDEPLSNLDAKLRVEMRAEIEELHQKIRITFLYVTHDQADALALADRMAVMNAGRVSAIGTPLELYARPPNAFCADFLGEANIVEGGGWRAEGGRWKTETVLGMWTADGQAQAGDKAICLVRPENLQPIPGPAEGFNSFEATITGLRMNGATVTVTLDAGGLVLRATLLTQQGVALRKGQRSLWGVAAVNTVVLPR